MARGRFIVVEGIDGCGSSTQARLLKDRLEGEGIGTLLTCEPCQGLIGRMIRQNLRKELTDPRDNQPHSFGWEVSALLFAADRLDHVQKEILPALEKGHWVVSDRYLFSSLTYQSLTAGVTRGEALEWIQVLNCRALIPDLTIIINASADVAASRRAKRGGAKELYEEDDLQRALAEAYSNPRDYLLHKNYALVNGNTDDPHEVFKSVWALIQKAQTDGFPDAQFGLSPALKQQMITNAIEMSRNPGRRLLGGSGPVLGYTEIARRLFPIEPMPQGALPIYDRDPEGPEPLRVVFPLFEEPTLSKDEAGSEAGLVTRQEAAIAGLKLIYGGGADTTVEEAPGATPPEGDDDPDVA